MSDELRPCPFCGNKDIQRYDYVNGKFRVTCWDCRNATKDWYEVDDAREGIVFDHSGGRWEKLAFTLYSDLVAISSDAKHRLEEIEENNDEQ